LKDESSAKPIDYKNVDFGYKNKHIPKLPGIGDQVDIATFLNDGTDMINFHLEEDSLTGGVAQFE